MAYVISISNGKGGVAKTTTSIALGCSLNKLSQRVLLIDLDHNASLTLGFGSIPKQTSCFSKDLFSQSTTKLQRGLKTEYKNLDIIPSNGNLSSLEERLALNHHSATLLRSSLNSLFSNNYDFIIIDCPASLGLLTVNALTASNLLIIPTQAEFFSAYALQTMFSLIKDIREEKNPSLQYRILITLLDLRLRDHRNILFQLQKHLGESLFKTMIQIDTSFRESQTQGIPITHSLPDSRGANQYKELASEILSYMSEHNGVYRNQFLEGTMIERGKGPVHSTQTTTEHHVSQKNHETSFNVPTNKLQDEILSDLKSCPYLKGKNDSQIALSYPSTWNKCHRSKPILSPSFSYQGENCLTTNYFSCVMIKDKSQTSLPLSIRSPLNKSDLLQHLKNLLDR